MMRVAFRGGSLFFDVKLLSCKSYNNMAITIDQQPDQNYIHSAWNPIEYLIDSTNYAQDGFKLLVTVQSDPSGSPTTIYTGSIFVIPGATDKLYIDIQDIVQSYISDTYSIPNGDTIDAASQDLLEVRVQFQEYYCSAGTCQAQGAASNTNNIFISRSAFSYAQYVNDDYQDWQLPTGAVADSTNHLLNGFENEIAVSGTTNPTLDATKNYKKIISTQKEQVRFSSVSLGATPTWRIYVALYDSSFSVTQSDYVSMGAIAEGKLYSFDIGPSELSAHTWVGGGITPTSSDVYMAVWVYDQTAGFAVSSARLFKINWDACDTYTNYEVHWLNRYGGFDSWMFQGKSRHDTLSRQAMYKSNDVTLSGSSIVNTIHRRSQVKFYTSLKEQYNITSDFLQEWEYRGLRDLITSSEIYIVIDDIFYSAMCKDVQTIRNYRDEEGEVYFVNVELIIDNSERRQW